jgi:ABC-2 type transport system permease protein
MNLRMLAALVYKDLTLYFKNRFYAFVTPLGLIAYLAIYFFLPNTVDETIQLGWYGPQFPEAVLGDLNTEGLILQAYPSEEALQQAVLDGDEMFGVALPPDFFQKLASGEKPQAVVYFESTLPGEYQDAYALLLEEFGYALAGQTLNLEVEEVVLGPDMVGQQVSPRRRFLPILAVLILMIETLGLASLISAEVETGTVRALLVTPLRVEGLFASKGVTGVLLAFVQLMLLFTITRGLQNEPFLVIVILLLGSVLVTGLSFWVASMGRDMMSVMGWGIMAMIILAIPAFNILLPGLTSRWIEIIPSYYMVDPIYRIINFEAGWEQVGSSLLVLLAFAVGFFGLGVVSLRRKLQ